MADTNVPHPVEPTPKSSCPKCGRWETCTDEITENLWFFRTRTILLLL